MKITKDLRRYTAPARGSVAWKNIFKRRTAVERVNAYLKEFFQLNNVRYCTGKRTKVHFDIVTLIYNASKLAVDRINTQLITQDRKSTRLNSSHVAISYAVFCLKKKKK